MVLAAHFLDGLALGDNEEPGAELVGAVNGGALVIGVEEDFLGNFFGEFDAAGVESDEADEALVEAADDGGHGAFVAGLEGGEGGGVDGRSLSGVARGGGGAFKGGHEAPPREQVVL